MFQKYELFSFHMGLFNALECCSLSLSLWTGQANLEITLQRHNVWRYDATGRKLLVLNRSRVTSFGLYEIPGTTS